MNLLAIDTSTHFASVALNVGDELYVEEQSNLRQHAQLLLPMIEQLLLRSGTNISQLDGIVFGSGPGSFTGLRITCALVKGLSFAHDLPLYAVNGLHAIADEVYEREGKSDIEVLAMIDARMHQIYWAHLTNQSEGNAAVNDPADVQCAGDAPLILAGVGFEAYIDQLPQSIQSRLTQQYAIVPHARAMIRLVQRGKGQRVSVHEATPVYIRNDVAKISVKG